MNLSFLKIRSEEIAHKISKAPHVKGKIKALRLKVKTKATFLKKRWAAALKIKNKALDLKRKSNTPINQPLPENVDDPLSEKKDKELAMKISQKEPALEILNKQHLLENKESGDLSSVKPAMETFQQMPRSLRPGKPSVNLFSDPKSCSVSENEICFDQSHPGNMEDNSFLGIKDMDPLSKTYQ
ncbi:hypothetical protein TNCV_3677071 [Trichonephila clavipes]|nr:hypothetical protein TNCV_3677071 [Trichonephila clavipes]